MDGAAPSSADGRDGEASARGGYRRMEREAGLAESNTQAQPAVQSQQQTERKKTCQVRYCTGCLYFSSGLKDSVGHPVCVGYKEGDAVPEDAVVSLIEKRSTLLNKLQRKPLNFKYCCLGYSLYVLSNSQTDPNSSEQGGKDFPLLDFPACVGIEFLSQNRKTDVKENSELSQEQDPSHVLFDKEEAPVFIGEKPYNDRYRTSFPSDEFVVRFVRNAKSIANRCASNISGAVYGIRDGITRALSQTRDRSK